MSNWKSYCTKSAFEWVELKPGSFREQCTNMNCPRRAKCLFQ